MRKFIPLQFIREYVEALLLERRIYRGMKKVGGVENIAHTLSHIQSELQPRMQRKFLAYAAPEVHSESPVGFSEWFKVLQIGLGTAAMVFVVSLVAASEPGQILHPYKTAVKEFRVSLSPSSPERVQAALALANANLEATKEVIEKSTSTKQKQAAVAELAKHTKEVIEKVVAVSGNTSTTASTQELIHQLTALTAGQIELAETLKTEGSAQDSAADTLVETTKANAASVATLEKSLQVAASDAVDSAKEGAVGEVKAAAAKAEKPAVTSKPQEEKVEEVEPPVGFKAGFIPESSE